MVFTLEPLTPLTRVLLVTVFALLILFSVFLGLFIGVDQRLSSRDPKADHGDEKTVISTLTTISPTTVITTVQPPRPTTAPREVGCQAVSVQKR